MKPHNAALLAWIAAYIGGCGVSYGVFARCRVASFGGTALALLGAALFYFIP